MKNKKVLSIVLVVVLVITMTMAVCAIKTTSFQDVAKESYYYDAVNWAVEQGITEGMGDGLFVPGNSCTRAQVVTFLWRHAGKPQPNGNSAAFTDVEPGTWYSDPVAWAVAQGITDGMGEGKFAPDGTCTRGQIVTFLWRYAGKPTVTGAENPFTDVKAGEWYGEAVLWAVSEGITNGVSDTSFAPNDSCTRGQVVTFLYRHDQSLQTEEAVPTESIPVETEPAETEPAQTEPSVTNPPATEPSVTNPPATEPSVTNPPATEPSETNPPATEEPSVTNPPATEPSVTNPPATEPPALKPSMPDNMTDKG